MDGLVMVYESILTLNIWFLLGTRQQKKHMAHPSFVSRKKKRTYYVNSLLDHHFLQGTKPHSSQQ